MTTPSEALAEILESHAEHFGMDETTVLQEAIETLAMAEKMARIAAVLPDTGDTMHILVPHQCAYRSALEEIEALDPEDFKEGQGHLTPAFRQPDIKAAFRRVVQIVNRVLHQTDEYGEPLPTDGPRSIDHLARAVVDACMATDDGVVIFKVTPAEYNEILKLGPSNRLDPSEWEHKIRTKVRTPEEHLAVGSRRVNLIVEDRS